MLRIASLKYACSITYIFRSIFCRWVVHSFMHMRTAYRALWLTISMQMRSLGCAVYRSNETECFVAVCSLREYRAACVLLVRQRASCPPAAPAVSPHVILFCVKHSLDLGTRRIPLRYRPVATEGLVGRYCDRPKLELPVGLLVTEPSRRLQSLSLLHCHGFHPLAGPLGLFVTSDQMELR